LIELLESRLLLTAEVAGSADRFVDSIGINTHMPTDPDLTNLVVPLGVRHLRDGALGNAALQTRLANIYLSNGIRSQMVANPGWTMTQAVNIAANAFVESLEAYNEPDLQSTGYSYTNSTGQTYQDNPAQHTFAATTAFYFDLFSAINANSSTSAKPVLSPALANAVNARYFQGIPFDVENIHRYTWSTPATGLNNSLNDTRWLRSSGDATVPVIQTEAGYYTWSSTWNPASDHSGISETGQAKYLLRSIAESFNAGIQKTYQYDLKDDPINGTESKENHFGLIRSDGTLKPAYISLKNLNAMLGESTWNTTTDTWVTPAFTPGALDYTMEGATANVRHTLLQKSNGDYYMLLWQDLSSYDFTNKTDTINPTASITLNFSTPIAQAQTYLLNSTTATGTYNNPQSLTLNVPDEVMLVKLTQKKITDPWSSSDIGSPGLAGSASQDGGTFTVKGGGADIWNTSDAFQFVNQPMAGNGQITARILSQTNTNANAKTGVMFRDSTAANTMFADVVVTPGNTVYFQWRTTAGATASQAAGPVLTGPAWVRLSRAGNVFTAYYSTNGTAWTQIGSAQTIAMAGNAKVGLAVTAHDNGQLSTAVIDSVSVSSPTVTISATDAKATENVGSDTGTFTVTRTGSTASALTVNYSVGGTATSGADYAAISGSVIIPAGATFATITITPTNDSLPEVDESVIVKLLSDSAYNLGSKWNDTVAIANDDKVDDFEDGDISNWARNPNSALAIENTKLDSGIHALKWTFDHLNHADQWGNDVWMTLANQDWTNATKLRLRFAVDAANVSADAGRTIYFKYYNAGVSQTGTNAADSFHIVPSSGYQTVDLNLGQYTRNQITKMLFYVDGLSYSSAIHTFYLDNIELLSEPVKASSSRVLADLNNGSTSGWTASPRSSFALESNVVDTGPGALRWTYNDDGANDWGNELQLNLTSQDWSSASKIRLRFAVDPSNAAADAGKSIYMGYRNNGAVVSTSAVGTFQVSSSLAYQTVELSLGAFTRTQVTQLYFYVNGSSYATGNHLFYLDNIMLI
jgi:hypothetical protein